MYGVEEVTAEVLGEPPWRCLFWKVAAELRNDGTVHYNHCNPNVDWMCESVKGTWSRHSSGLKVKATVDITHGGAEPMVYDYDLRKAKYYKRGPWVYVAGSDAALACILSPAAEDIPAQSGNWFKLLDAGAGAAEVDRTARLITAGYKGAYDGRLVHAGGDAKGKRDFVEVLHRPGAKGDAEDAKRSLDGKFDDVRLKEWAGSSAPITIAVGKP